MDIAEMMVIGKVDLVMGFAANGNFVFFGDDKAIIYVGAFNNFESDDSLF